MANCMQAMLFELAGLSGVLRGRYMGRVGPGVSHPRVLDYHVGLTTTPG